MDILIALALLKRLLDDVPRLKRLVSNTKNEELPAWDKRVKRIIIETFGRDSKEYARYDGILLLKRAETMTEKEHAYIDHVSQREQALKDIIQEHDLPAKVEVHMPDIKSPESTTVVALPGNEVPEITHLTTGDKEGEQESQYTWDVFISHATEDKDIFVRQLAKELGSKGLQVWYDEFTLRIGDSLRQSIDKGLSESRYGIVVLSPYFFAGKWPQDELNGLAVRERKGEKVILPVWLNVDLDYVAKYSPMLADRLAAKASNGMDKVILDLLAVIRPNS